MAEFIFTISLLICLSAYWYALSVIFDYHPKHVNLGAGYAGALHKSLSDIYEEQYIFTEELSGVE